MIVFNLLNFAESDKIISGMDLPFRQKMIFKTCDSMESIGMARNSSYSIDFNSAEWLELFAKGRPRTYAAGSQIAFQGHISEEVLYIQSGMVKHSCHLSNGAEKILAYETSPLLFGAPSAYIPDPTPITTYAITRLETIVIPTAVARAHFDRNQQLSNAVIISLIKKLQSLSNHASSMYLPVPKRLAKFLLNTADYGIFIGEAACGGPHLRHEDIAAILGTTRPRVSQFLNDLRKMGLIEMVNNEIIVSDQEALARYIDS